MKITKAYVLATFLLVIAFSGRWTAEAASHASHRQQVDPTAVETETPTPTLTPTLTPLRTLEPTYSPVPIPSTTHTPIPSATLTPTPSATHTPIPSDTPTPIPTATHTPIPSSTPTFTPSPSAQPTQRATPLSAASGRLFLPLLARYDPPIVSPPLATITPTLAAVPTQIPPPLPTATAVLTPPTATVVVFLPTATSPAQPPPPPSGDKPWCPIPPSTGFNRRSGAICNDGWTSSSTGRGTCSSHGGVRCWIGAP
jgi:hypothetical protein